MPFFFFLFSLAGPHVFRILCVGAASGMYAPAAGELEEMQDFGTFVEGVRQWGRDERAKYGL